MNNRRLTQLGDTILTYQSDENINSSSLIQNFNAGIQLRKDSTVNFQFKTNYSNIRSNSDDKFNNQVADNFQGILTMQESEIHKKDQVDIFNLTTGLHTASKNKRFTTLLHLSLNNESGKSTDNNQRNIHYLKNETVDLTVRIIQDKTDHEQLFGIQPDLEMNYSLNKRNSFTALLKTEFRENKRERIASELDTLTQSKLYNQDLSNSAYLKQRMITPGIRYKHSSGNKHILLSVLHQTITDAGNFKTNATSINRQQTYWLPQAELGLGPMVLSYSKRIAGFLPVDKLDPYTDSTNRLYIVQGNPGLLPAVINEFRFQYSGRPTANLVSINVNAYFQKTDQQLTDHITVNPDGITFIQPVNTDNNISAGISGSVSKQWTDDKNSFYIRVTGNANYYRNEVLYNSSSDRVHSRQAGFTVSGNLTLNRIFSSIPSYGVQYTDDIFC